jgi:hypothetical protein
VRIEFRRPDAHDAVGAAVWDDGRVRIEAADDKVRAALARIFRPTPVATDDPAYRRQGTYGEVVLHPGRLDWFRAAAFARAREFDLVPTVVPSAREGGWDPAAAYLTFGEVIERLQRSR